MEKTGKAVNAADSLPLRFGSFAEEFVASEYARQTEAALIHYPGAVTHPRYDYLAGHIDRFVVRADSKDPSEPKAACPKNGNASKGGKTLESPVSPMDATSPISRKKEAGKSGPAYPEALPVLTDQTAQITITRLNEKLSAIGPNQVLRLLECKTANPFTQQHWGEPGTDQIPLPYLCQCLWYLAITQLDQIDLAVLFGNSDFKIYKIHRDLALEATLLEKAINFWERFVLTDIPPPASCEADYQTLFAKESPAKTIEAPASVVSEMRKITELQHRIDEAEKELSSVKQQVMATMQDAEVLTYCGKIIATWKTPKPTQKIDAKKFVEQYPEIAAGLTVTTHGTRRLLIKPAVFT